MQAVKGGKGVEGNSNQYQSSHSAQKSRSGYSDAIFPKLLNEQVDKYGQFKKGADILVPEKITERPKRRL